MMPQFLSHTVILGVLLCSVLTLRAENTVVINEIHYKPVEVPAFNADGTPVVDLTEEEHEFIELRNATAAPITLTGWRLSSGIDFAFPNGTTIPANGYLVVAKNPARLETVYAGLNGVLGPYTGALKNSGERVRLRNASDVAVDDVSYRREFPWPNGADGLGGGDDFTLLNSADYQYKGRSLQRVSADAEANDPANWLASPLGSAPTPGAANAVSLAVPKPVVISYSVAQAGDSSPVIRAAQQVRVQVMLSDTAGVTVPQIEYFVDVIDGPSAYSEPRATVALTALGNNQFSATLPGQADRSVVRWRVNADRGDGLEQVFPRTDDAAIVPVGRRGRQAWASYFVQPVRTTTKTAIYDVFVSNSNTTSGAFNGLNGLAAMDYNITGNPKRVTTESITGLPREEPYVPSTEQIWNGSVPCIFVENGVVRDAHLRYHGSRWNRRASRKSFKLRFSDTEQVDGVDSFFVTDKDDFFSVCHGLYINLGLPVSDVNWVDWYLNNDSVLTRLQQGEYNGDLLDKYHERIADLNPGTPKEENGELYKSAGHAGVEGPYGRGDERELPDAGPWSAWERYEFTYGLQNNGWKGSRPIMDFIEGMWTARGDSLSSPNPNITNLRAYFDTHLDVDSVLTSLALANWMCPWDDASQNHFLWKRANGRWNHLLWDFDEMFGIAPSQDSNSWIYLGENGSPSPATNALGPVRGNDPRGPTWFKDSVFRAYRTEFNAAFWLLNNTYLHPDNLKTLFYRQQDGTLRSYYDFINGVNANFCEERFQSVNLQTGHAADGSDFFRPVKPANAAPVASSAILPPSSFSTSAYAHTSGNTTGNNAHTKTKWEIRSNSGTYFAPVYVSTSTASLTSLEIPFDQLTFGETYYWRTTHIDASEHPSVPSDESEFTYGPQASQQTLIPFNATWKFDNSTAFTDNSWTLAGFDDGDWASGTAALAQSGEAISAPATFGTAVPAPGRLTPAGRAYLFRRTFTLSGDPMTVTNLRIRHAIDDGCVIWINGNKVHRYFMDEQASYSTAELSDGSPGENVMQFADAITGTTNWSYVDPRPFLVQGLRDRAARPEGRTTPPTDPDERN